MTSIPGFFQGTGMPDPDWWEALWPDPKQVLELVGIKPDMEVVDLCSGDGWFTLPLARIVHNVIAIDIDKNLLDAAQHRLEGSGISNCRYVLGDAYDLATLVSTPVDFVFLANAFHGVPDKLRLSLAVRAILKQGGCFAIINWYARPREETTVLGLPRGPATNMRMTPEATIAEVELSGLTFRSVVEVSPYHYSVVFENADRTLIANKQTTPK